MKLRKQLVKQEQTGKIWGAREAEPGRPIENQETRNKDNTNLADFQHFTRVMHVLTEICITALSYVIS